MDKILRIIYFVLLAVSGIMVILFYVGGDVQVAYGVKEYAQPIYTGTYLVWAYILAGVAVASVLVTALFQMVSNFSKAKKGLIGVLVLVVFALIAYSLADTETLNLTEKLQKYNVPSTLRNVGAGLYTAYILAGLAIASMIYSEIAKAFK